MTAIAAEVSHVRSTDGTSIGYATTGTGPPLVLVHGTTASHTTWQRLQPHLERRHTLHAMDRRGRGLSADAPVYALEREYEDVIAVVDEVAARHGRRVDLFGHSFGGLVAFGAAARTEAVGQLVLYEGWPTPEPTTMALPPDLRSRIEALLDTGAHEAALEAFYRDVVHITEEELAYYRTSPVWSARVDAAPTILREDPTTDDAQLDPDAAGRIDARVLLLVGEDSPRSLWGGVDAVAAALRDARIEVLPGQQHLAHHTVPDRFARHVSSFLLERGD